MSFKSDSVFAVSLLLRFPRTVRFSSPSLLLPSPVEARNLHLLGSQKQEASQESRSSLLRQPHLFVPLGGKEQDLTGFDFRGAVHDVAQFATLPDRPRDIALAPKSQPV